MKKIILASSNQGKIREIQAIIKDAEVLSLKDAEELLGKQIVVTEEQDTFEGNALEKVRGLYEQVGSGYICIADDSGLSIDALDGFPGVFTARWMDADDHTKNLELIKKVDASGDNSRICHYTTVIALKSDTEEKCFESTLDGTVADHCRGDNGFGFDEIFVLPDGSTLAEIDMDTKNQLSPRRKALDELKQYMNNKEEA
ncbi:non-canonical purine NTP pyrophosphatase [Candidatus Saccharibacteria bacterium]|nr:non-canonical purine NTP pyrophosphatase [Candidatus Saccharibacteria bacterium]